MSWSADTSKLFICDMLFALQCMHGFGLVHGDLKPDNIMVGPTGTVYLIDFGSVCRPGDPGPMSCGAYRPPEADVSISWDVYSIGLILCELGAEGLKLCPCVKVLCSDMSAGAAEEELCLRQCVSRVLRCVRHFSYM